MTFYLVAKIVIHDSESYSKYTSSVTPILAKYNGRLLVATDQPEQLEGEWKEGKLVVIEFSEKQSALQWLHSPEYREVATHRHASATTTLVGEVPFRRTMGKSRLREHVGH